MPQSAFVGKQYDLTPALNDDNRQLIQSETRDYFEPSKHRTVTVDIYIMDGTQSFKIGEMKETLSLEFAVRIEVINQDDVGDVAVALGEARIAREAPHLDRDTLPELYALVIRQSLEKGFGRILNE